jgi:hypothetical protein
MQESKHREWSDIANGMLHVHAKPAYGFGPKTWEERRIPVVPVLMSLLHQMTRRPGTPVFPCRRSSVAICCVIANALRNVQASMKQSGACTVSEGRSAPLAYVLASMCESHAVDGAFLD